MIQSEGKHLLVDSLCHRHASLINVDIGKSCLMDIVTAIDMTMVLPPVSVKFPKPDHDIAEILKSLKAEGLGQSKTAQKLKADLAARAHLHNGYSSFVMIAESHLSLHTFPEANFLSFDCYSCKGFDHDVVLDVLDKAFGLSAPKTQILTRAFPGQLGEEQTLSNTEVLLAHRSFKAASRPL